MRHVFNNQSEVVEKYMEQSQKRGRNRTESLFFEGKILYSYGHHFPVAILLKDGTFLINGDRYSSTTSRQQATVRNILEPQVVVSRDALEGILEYISETYQFSDFDPYFNRLTYYKVRVKDQSERDYHEVDVGTWQELEETLKRFRKEYSAVGYYKRTHTEEDRKYWSVWGHTAETILLALTLGGIEFDILCSFDEAGYFCSLLPESAETIAGAYHCLKPIEVVSAPKDAEIYRQGEWFFIYQFPTSECFKRLGTPLNQITQRPLPYLQGGNRHHTRYVMVRGNPYCLGGVYHRTPWGVSTGEHKTLHLPQKKIFKAVRNRELFSSTATAPVD